MKKLIILFLFSVFTTNTFAQDITINAAPKHVIHGSFGTFVLINSVQFTYDGLLAQKENGFFKSYYGTVKVGGHATLDFSGGGRGTGLVTSVGVTGLTGKGKNHFELGLGIGYFFEESTAEVNINPDNTVYPSIAIGYRKQNTKGFMFRTGVGVVEWAYVGFGFSF